MDFKKIYTGDYYADGFNDGAKQGAAGKPKWVYSVFTKVQPANYVINFNRSFDTYFRGYNEGHAEAIKTRLKVDTFNQSQQTGANMTTTQQATSTPSFDIRSYEDGLEKLRISKQKIERSMESLNNSLRKYKQKIEEAQAAGMLENYIKGLRTQHGQLKVIQESMTLKLIHMLEAIEEAEEKIQFLINETRY